jgi:hypothetical protein
LSGHHGRDRDSQSDGCNRQQKQLHLQASPITENDAVLFNEESVPLQAVEAEE